MSWIIYEIKKTVYRIQNYLIYLIGTATELYSV